MHNLLLRQNRNYRLLFTGSALSNLADGIAALAFPWLATMISSNPMHIAIVAFATRLPWFLLALPAGVITDRADRQRLMVGADIIRLLLSLGVVGIILGSPALPLAEDSTLRLPMILALASVAFLIGTAEVFRDNTAQTVLPMLVEPKDLESANGQIWSIEQVMGSFVGPPVAGLLIALAVPAPFGFDALMFALSAWCLWLIAFPLRKEIRVPAGFLSEFRDGLRWIVGNTLILRLAVMLGILNALHTMTLTILVLFAQEVLLASAFGYGLLLTAGAAGGVLGGLVCPAIARRIGNGPSLLIALGIFPLPYLVIAGTSSSYLVATALFVEMLAALLWNVVTVSYRQRVIPNTLLGRVNGIYRFLGWGMMPLGALAGGWIVSVAEIDLGRETALRLPFLCAAFGCGLLLIYGALKLRFPRQGSD
ncbi:MFS transporter [Hoeflea poritis]|uniref:MFS transporter n=1 Tax=Hoeflea poritis TaxID=2993659 RepID=A0ABT4VLY3_9HYPH|nr:MFS transporter [Hoeflea poritis]MDA4845732.1 MFS transporter [Hoeflea poritis]